MPELAALDVRLTMGGEPTFVSIDDPDGAEWNTDARWARPSAGCAADLFQRLRERYAPAGLAHFGQGKWYPGRAAAALVAELLLAARRRADLDRAARCRRRATATTARTPRVAPALPRAHGRERLGSRSDATCSRPTRTRSTTCGASGACRSNVDPFDSRLEDPQERARLARVFEQGLERVVGYVLPLARDAGRPRAGRAGRGSCAPSAAT